MQLSFNNKVFSVLVLVVLVGVQAQEEGNLRAARTLQQTVATNDLDPTPNVWIVQYHPGTSSASSVTDQLAAAGTGKVGFVYKHVIQGFVYHGTDVDHIKAHPKVKSVTRDGVSKMTATTSGQTIPTGIQRIFAATKGYLLKAPSSCRCDAVVAVLDTGVDFQHPDLNVNAAMSVDCTQGSTAQCLQGLGDDDNGHGSHVSGTIGAIGNSLGVIGVCPGAEIWSIKVLDSTGSGYNSWILAGLDYVTSQASTIDVANMSLAGNGCFSYYCAAIAKAKNAGVAFAVAAGNDNALASGYTPACCVAVLGKFYKAYMRHLSATVTLTQRVDVSQRCRLCQTRMASQVVSAGTPAVVARTM
jgi:subtilisin